MHPPEKPLNIHRAKHYLLQLGLSSHQFAFNSLGSGDCFCLTYHYAPKEDWAVFYSERGNRYDIKEFDNENDACKYLIELVITSFLNHPKFSEERRKMGHSYFMMSFLEKKDKNIKNLEEYFILNTTFVF